METFSNKYINDFKYLEKATIGFEFEFYCTKPYYKLLELLNRELDPVQVSGKRVYHSSFKPTDKHWKIEPDLSMGFDGIELITGPMSYVDAKIYLLKVLKLLQSDGFSTDDKCSIHINISFDEDKSEKLIGDLNNLKLILNVDEEKIYNYFPSRKNNFYCKSVKNIIPFKNFDFTSNSIGIIENSMELPDTKYYGINFLNHVDGRIEIRYIGGENYQFKTSEITSLMDYFILLLWDSIGEKLNEEDIDLLKYYLNKNINQYKKYSTIEGFIAEFPSITLQVDQSSETIILKTYYEQFYDDLYELITNTYNLNDCIINFNTLNQRLEIVDANIKTIFDIRNVDIIDCFVDSGSFANCEIVNTEIKNCHLLNTKVYGSDVFKSKITSCEIDQSSILTDCYLFNTFLNGIMKGGVFRSGKLGEYAELDKNVKIVTPSKNYFNTKIDDEEDKKIDLFGKSSNIKNKWLKGYKGFSQKTTF